MAITASAASANTAPTLLAPLNVAYDEDSNPLSVNLLSGASDSDGDALSVASLAQSGGQAPVGAQ